MSQDDIVESPTEVRIREALKNHPQLDHLGDMCDQFKAVVTRLQGKRAHEDMIAVAACTHLAGLLAAQKMAGIVKPEFLDLLLDDVVDTVRNRAIVGEIKFHTKQ